MRSHRRDGRERHPYPGPTSGEQRSHGVAASLPKWPLTWRFVLAAQGWTRANQGRVAGEECASGSDVLRTRTCPYDSRDHPKQHDLVRIERRFSAQVERGRQTDYSDYPPERSRSSCASRHGAAAERSSSARR